MTEAQAKTKWCPHAREIGEGDYTYNRNYAGKATTKCIGSACMAWRQVPTHRKQEIALHEKPAHWPDSDGVLVTGNDHSPRQYVRMVSVPASGFCGLAGAPQ